MQVEHENWLLAHKSYQSQRHSILRAWARDREDLLLKVQATFADAWIALEEHMQKRHTRQQQQQICQELYEKVIELISCLFGLVAVVDPACFQGGGCRLSESHSSLSILGKSTGSPT